MVEDGGVEVAGGEEVEAEDEVEEVVEVEEGEASLRGCEDVK